MLAIRELDTQVFRTSKMLRQCVLSAKEINTATCTL